MSKMICVLSIFLGLAMTDTALAAPAQSWRDTGIEQFAEGELDNVSITAEGKLRLAPDTRELARLDCLFIWSLAQDSEGNIYMGTDNGGAVMKLDTDGNLTRLLDTGEMNVFALTVDSRDNIYAGTAPNGLIFKISPDGQDSLFYNAEAKYIWALEVDGEDNLLAATGSEGAVLRISQDGFSEQLFAAADTHVYSLLYHPAHGIFAGTSPSGLVYHRKPDGELNVLLDAPEPDIRTLSVNDANKLFVGTASDLKDNVNEGRALRPTEEPSPGFDDREAGENSLYVIDLDAGQVLRGLGVMHTSIFSSLWSDGSLYIGTGDQGGLLKVTEEMGLELAQDRSEKQILSMAASREGGMLLGTGNPAVLLMASDNFASRGQYTSRPKDSQFGARWGRLEWIGSEEEGVTSVEILTRSGNTRKPDDSWSEWDRAKNADGRLSVGSEPARFLQYRIVMQTESAERSPGVERISVHFRQRNIPPIIKSMEVAYNDAADGNQGEAHNRASVSNITWSAEDPNENKLEFALAYRKEGEDRFYLITDSAGASPYQWETMYVPDGIYRVLLVASDSPDNPADQAMVAEELSEPLVIDNTRPRVENLTINGTPRLTLQIRGVAVNDTSNIAKIEYSIRGGEWTQVAPVDGINDSSREEFDFETERVGIAGGSLANYILVRVKDERGNVGVARAQAGVPAD